MKEAYEEVKLALNSEHKFLSDETLSLCLEALREHEENREKNICHGYSNYPTWLVSVNITNDKDLYENYMNFINDLEEANASEVAVRGILSQTIESDFNTKCMKAQYKLDGDIWASMLNFCHASIINYTEIAERLCGFGD